MESFVAAAEILKERGAYKIFVMATHGLLSADAPRLIEESSIDEVSLLSPLQAAEEGLATKPHKWMSFPWHVAHVWNYSFNQVLSVSWFFTGTKNQKRVCVCD